ncbi:MAG: histidine kinase dimerization/phosphoacceptor domain -containing protein [Treponemataceae bacterium]
MNAEIRKRAEEKAHITEADTSKELLISSPAEVDRLVHELHVHQIQLEMQNEELIRTQEELASAYARYFELYELAPVGYFSISKAGLIVEANLAGAKLLGIDRGALVKQPFTRFIQKEDQDINYRQQKRLYETGEPQACELRMIGPNQIPFWAQIQSSFTRDSSGGTPVSRCVVSDISIRKAAEEERASLALEKEMLLKETHHRIKNNMNVINSLLILQANQQDIPESTEILCDAAGRVQSMMMLYDKLYRSETHHELSVKAYLPPLVADIIKVFLLTKHIKTVVEVDDFVLSAKILSPLGIILNELITNSMKYAFIDRESGTITLTVSKSGYAVTLTYSDDGVGLPEAVTFDDSATFGLLLVKSLTQQLQGTIAIDREKGTKYTIRFSI